MVRVGKFILFALSFYFPEVYGFSSGAKRNLKNFLRQQDFYTRSNHEYLIQGRVLANSEVKTLKEGKEQVVWAKVAGLHSSKCTPVLAKLSRYEDYSKYIGFVGHSSYSKGIFRVELKIPLLPATFGAAIKIARVDKVGEYPFTMIAGALKDSTGKVKVEESEGRCLLYARFDQKGSHFGYSDFIMESFFTTVAKLALEKMFSLTGHKVSS